MNKAQLIDAVQKKLNTKRADAESMVNLVLGTVSDALKSEGTVSLSGFGSFRVKARKGREGINPATKDRMYIAPTKNVTFRVAQKLKQEL